jgi:predicted dinucleotide-binding enzyme
VTPGSAAQEIAAVAPEGAHVVKALNTIFGHVVAHGTPLDAFIAGDSAEAKATLATFLDSLDMRTLDAGGLQAAPILESAGLLLMGLARNGAGFELAWLPRSAEGRSEKGRHRSMTFAVGRGRTRCDQPLAH